MKVYNSIEIISINIWLNIKTFIKNPVEVFLYLWIIFMTITIPTIFSPIEYSLGMSISFLIFAITLISFKRLFIDYNQSTLRQNENLNNKKECIRLTSSIMTVIIINVIAYTLFSLLLSFISNIYHLSNALITLQEVSYSYEVPYFFKYGYFIYNVLLLSLISISILIFASKFITTSKGITFLGISILIVIFIYGGLFNNYFYISNWEINVNGQAMFRSLLFPEYIYYPSLLMPFYPQSQMMSAISTTTRTDFQYFEGLNQFGKSWSDSPWIWSSKEFYNWTVEAGKVVWESSNPWKWNILWFIPYMQIILFITLSKVTNIIRGN